MKKVHFYYIESYYSSVSMGLRDPGTGGGQQSVRGIGSRKYCSFKQRGGQEQCGRRCDGLIHK